MLVNIENAPDVIVSQVAIPLTLCICFGFGFESYSSFDERFGNTAATDFQHDGDPFCVS
jgi:hypothetical protein